MSASVVSLVAEGDLVAYFLKMQGTNSAYKRQTIWTDCGFFRIVKGKIVEGWGCDDEFSRNKQLGYQTYPPVV
ncbi:MAG: ester cyclase [Anaerolineales bacterium]|nr:ester cyclase [Anaerolineales bacterium]